MHAPVAYVFATTSSMVNGTYAVDLVQKAGVIASMLIPPCIAVGVIVFLIGAIRLIARGADAHERIRGRKNMLWGVIGLCLAVSVWGVVALLTNTFGLDTAARPPLPTTPPLLR